MSRSNKKGTASAKNGRDEFKQERKRRIAEIALRIFVEKTYEKAKVKDIAAACGMSIGSLYDYMPSKENMLIFIVDMYHDRWRTGALVKDAEKLSNWGILEKQMRRWLDYSQANSYGVALSYREIARLPDHARRKFLSIFREKVEHFAGIVQKGIEAGEFRQVDPKIMAYTICTMGHMWQLGRWYWDAIGRDFNTYADEQINNVKGMLVAHGAPAKASPGREVVTNTASPG